MGCRRRVVVVLLLIILVPSLRLLLPLVLLLYFHNSVMKEEEKNRNRTHKSIQINGVRYCSGKSDGNASNRCVVFSVMWGEHIKKGHNNSSLSLSLCSM